MPPAVLTHRSSFFF
uniref:Uncharacterized protein n=1 Tax=Arundo donax TaxID=35708 RepID=A0A0A9BWM0_ARUDO